MIMFSSILNWKKPGLDPTLISITGSDSLLTSNHDKEFGDCEEGQVYVVGVIVFGVYSYLFLSWKDSSHRRK